MKRIINILFGICISILVHAQTSEVKDITPLGFSGNFTSVEYMNDSYLLALGDNGCMYESYDTGKVWIPKLKLFPEAKYLQMLNAQNGFMYGEYNIYMTDNGGTSWEQMSLTGIPDGTTISRVYKKNQDTIFAAGTTGENGMKIYLKASSVEQWEKVADNLYNPYVLGVATIYFNTPSHGYAFGIGYYAETFDGGKSWTKVLIDANIRVYGSIVTSDNTLIQSYSTVSASPPILDGVVWYKAGIYKFIENDNTIIGIWDNALHYTIDNGLTWSVKSNSVSTDFVSFAELNDSTMVLVGDDLTSYITTNGGETWTKYVHGGAEGFNNLYCKNEQECFITGSTGRLFRTQNGGDTWTWDDIHNTGLREIEFPTQDTGYIIGSNVLFMTIDGGDTWNKKTLSMTNAALIEFPSSTVGYAGYSSGSTTIKKTINTGGTWSDPVDVNYFYNSEEGNKFSFRTPHEGVVCGPDNLLLHTEDGGINWEVIDSIPLIYNKIDDVLFISNKGWLVEAINYPTTVDIYYCDNDFNCQIVFAGNGFGFINLQQINDSTYAISHDTLDYISTDYGITWNELEVMIPGYIDFVDIHHAFSMSSYNISKAYINVSEITLTITKNSNRNYTLSPSFTGNKVQVTIYVKDSKAVLHTIAQNVTLQNSVNYTLQIPQDIAIGSYTIYIEPQSSAYAPVESQRITIDNDTGLHNWSSSGVEKSCYTLQGNILHITAENVKVYNIMGIQIPVESNSMELEYGVYIVETECGSSKVIVNY